MSELFSSVIFFEEVELIDKRQDHPSCVYDEVYLYIQSMVNGIPMHNMPVCGVIGPGINWNHLTGTT